MWGDWISPELSSSGYYVVSVDRLCDMGRSIPLDGNPDNCPQSPEQLALWFEDIVRQLGITEPASIVGYSYGSFAATILARERSSLVDKLVLIAPAAVFGPIVPAFVFRAVLYGIATLIFPFKGWRDAARDWFMKYLIVDPTKSIVDVHRHGLRAAMDDAGQPIVPESLNPREYSVEELRKLQIEHPTLLVIGEQERITNAEHCIETAKKAGIQVQSYSGSGHLLLLEHPRESVVEAIASFLAEPKEEQNLIY
jgi:pimeloyl-ACP methyl ester carboxylesterase